MKKNYEHIFFDLDHTLWDYERNSAETLSTIFDLFSIKGNAKASPQQFFKTFTEVNFHLWDLYDRELIDKSYIREHRFAMIFEKMALKQIPPLEEVSDFYLSECPKKIHLINGTLEVLHYLEKKYQLHILTNGFQDVQKIKLESCGLASFFQTVTTSECCGYKKPNPKMFEFAMKKAKTSTEKSLMIGDNIISDIGGAISIGMDSVFYNPEKKQHLSKGKYEIRELLELVDLL